MYLAVTLGEPDYIRVLVAGGVDPDAPLKNGRTAFQILFDDREMEELDRLATMEALLEAGARIELARKRSVLFECVCNDSADMLDLLCQNGLDVTEKKNGDNVLHHLISLDDEVEEIGEKIEVLCAHGCDINGPNNWSQTPLHVAVEESNHEAISALCNCGANLEAVNDEGDTPLLAVAKFRDDISIYILLKAGANAEARDADGMTISDYLNEPVENLMERLSSLPVGRSAVTEQAEV